MSQLSEYSYLDENNDYYRGFWASEPAYRNRYPNAEEAERLGPVLRIVSRLIEERKIPACDARILDLGSGRGCLTQILSLYGRVEGCEPTPEAVTLARRLFPHLTFQRRENTANVDFRCDRSLVSALAFDRRRTSKLPKHSGPRSRRCQPDGFSGSSPYHH